MNSIKLFCGVMVLVLMAALAGFFFILEKASILEARGIVSGVYGKVEVAANCMEENSSDQNCRNKPLQAKVFVKKAELPSGVEEAGPLFVPSEIVNSDANGLFRIALEPGKYILVPKVSENYLKSQRKQQSVTVEPNEYAKVMILYEKQE